LGANDIKFQININYSLIKLENRILTQYYAVSKYSG